jgi:hypothetical protein
MILTQTLEVKCSSRNITQFRKNNPELKIGDKVEIPIQDLSAGSKQKIKVRCSHCQEVKEVIYYDYNKITNHQKTPYFCKKCKGIKTKQTIKEKYGVDNVFQLEEVKEKSKITNLEKYGTEYALQNKEIQKKQQATNLEKYGVSFIPQLNLPKYNKNSFEKAARKVHGTKYDYDLVNYINSETKVKIICPFHGIFEQLPKSHLKGYGCEFCSIEKLKNSRRDTKIDFLIKAHRIHGLKYDYSQVNYVNSYTKVKIICFEHGIFEQRPQDHLNSANGCPICSESKGEKIIRIFLENHQIAFIPQKTFEGCVSKNELYFDFYLPEYNLCIEYDGIQHYKVVERWGGEKGLKERQKRDQLKDIFCQTQDISLLRIRYDENPLEVLSYLFIEN